MRNPVAVLAVFFALAGTSIAAGRLVDGDAIRDDSLTGRDFESRSLRAHDFGAGALRGPRGPSGPQGLAGPQGPSSPASGPADRGLAGDLSVGADGAVVGGSQAYATVTHPATGVYCVQSYGAFVQATSLDVDAPKIVAADNRAADPCPRETSITVAVFSPDGAPADGAFHLVIS